MRGVRAEYAELDYLFAHEGEVTDKGLMGLMMRSYELARADNSLAAEVASRRYRAGEHRYTTCRHLFISEAQYYKLLSRFLAIAQTEQEKTAR